jgi:DNA-binding SARP family transcriptional activator
LRDPKVQGLIKDLCQRSSDPEFMKAIGYQDPSAQEGGGEMATLPTGHSLRLFGLGKMDFFVDGRALAEPVWKRNQKAKLLLFRLCLDPQRSFTDEMLIEELWPGQEHASKANLNALRATLRSALRGGEAGDGFEYIVREGKGTRIHPECKVILDARELSDAVQRARQSKGEAFERMHLTKVVELYTGPFLESCYLEWAVSTRNTLEQSVLESLHRLCQLAEESQNYDQVLECSTRILQLDRCNQEAYRLGMQGFIQSGRPEQAVRLFERGSRVLKAELEMEPSIELLSLYHRAKLSL